MTSHPIDPSALNRPKRAPEVDASFARSEAEYRKLANALPQIIWTCDAAGAPRVGERSLDGADRPERGGVATTRAPSSPCIPTIGRSCSAASGRRWRPPVRARSSTGSAPGKAPYRFHLARVVPVRDEDGVITRWVAGAFDIHDRRQAEEALRASERQVRDGLSTSIRSRRPSPACPTGHYLNVNDAFLKLTGFSRDEVVGKTAVALGIWTAEERAAALAPLTPRQTCRDRAPLSDQGRARAHALLKPAPASTSAASPAWSTWRPT